MILGHRYPPKEREPTLPMKTYGDEDGKPEDAMQKAREKQQTNASASAPAHCHPGEEEKKRRERKERKKKESCQQNKHR
jgi:hypothetical protein